MKLEQLQLNRSRYNRAWNKLNKHCRRNNYGKEGYLATKAMIMDGVDISQPPAIQVESIIDHIKEITG